MRTYSPKESEITRSWHVIDAEGLVLGRLSTEVARLLRGKHRPYFTPHLDTGDFVVIVNADKIKLSSDKADKKFVYRHSGYPGGIRKTRWSDLLANNPTKLVYDSIKGMVPHTRLGSAQIGKLFVYSGPTHPHAAQQPVPFDTSAIRRG
ncbi:MAG: 50S ribosomal protein L13 [Actinomycetes bacterium]